MEVRRSLRLVSFDGGGVHSLSQLEIMRTIMHQLNWNKKSSKTKLPCEQFDLMGGSGTGGLIAIMLARLRMSMDEAFDEFSIIVEQVFDQDNISPPERTARLRKCMEDIMGKRGHPLDMTLLEETESGCVCFVLASLRNNAGTKICLRGYPVQTYPAPSITVVDAALATCAIQPTFAPIVSGKGFRKKEYIGAGMGASNPIREVITEAHLLFGGNANVTLLLSLGNGHPGIIKLPPSDGDLDLSRALWDVMNDCTQKAQEIEQQIGSTGMYFRFSVEQGMQNDHSTQFTDPSWIIAQTESYIDDPGTHNKLNAFVQRIDAAAQPITLDQLKSGHIPSVTVQLPSDVERRQLDVVVSNPDDAILEKLKPSDLVYGPQVSECMEGTRKNILEEINRWMDDIDAPNIFWLKGYPGVGKSAIAVTLVEQLRASGRLWSGFFFQRERANDMTPSALWRVVAYDLGRQLPDIKTHLVATLNKDETILNTRNIDGLFRLLIHDPLTASKEISTAGVPIVVIDALDECGGRDGKYSEHRENLLRSIKIWACLPGKFKLFVTGRGENDIERFFMETPHHLLEIFAGRSVQVHSSQDINKFLKRRFKKIAIQYPGSLSTDWPGLQISDELTCMAGGLFIWAKTVADFAERGDPEEQLNKILSGGGASNMVKLYSLILNMSFPDPSETVARSFRSILGAVILAEAPLDKPSLVHLLSLKATTVDHICNGLRSVMESHNNLRIHHQSFVDFLIDEDKCSPNFFVDRRRESRTLVLACFRTMANQLRFNICGLESSYLRNSEVLDLDARVRDHIPPHLSYSSCSWASHLIETTFDPDILDHLQNFMNNHYLHWLEVLSAIKCVNLASSMLWLLIDWLQNCRQDTAMARDMQKFVATFGSVVSQSLPHIYLSALPFAPQRSNISKQYTKKYPRILAVCQGGQTEWPATQNILSGHTDKVSSATFSPDGRWVVSGSGDKTIRVWDAETGEVVVGPLIGHTDDVHSVAFSPNGRRIVSSSDDKTIRVWDAETGKMVIGPLQGHCDWVRSVAFSPDGSRIVSGSDDRTIRLWDAETGDMTMRPFVGHTGYINSVGFSPDGMRIVSGSRDNTIRIWNAETGEIVTQPLEGHNDWVQSVAFSPDGSRIVSGSRDRTIRLWDSETGDMIIGPLVGYTSHINSIGFSPNGMRMVSGSCDNTIRIWSAETGKMVAGPFIGHTGDVHSVSFSPDGRRVISGSEDETIRVWDAETGEVVAKPFIGHDDWIQSVAFSPDGRQIVSGSQDMTIRIWNSETGEMVTGPFIGHTDYVHSVAFSSDGRWIVSGSEDNTIRVWDSKTGEMAVGPFVGHDDQVQSVAFSPDGRRVVSGSSDRTVRLWDTETGEMVIKPFEGHEDWVRSVAFSPDGRRVVSGSSDKTVRLWETETGETVVGPFEGHDDWVRSVAFSSDGRRLASGSDDRTIRVWNAETGEAVAKPFIGHDDWIQSVAFSPDGRRIVSCSNDRTIRLWETETGEMVVGPLEGHDNWILSVAFSPNGRQIVSSSGDKTIRVWDIETEEIIPSPRDDTIRIWPADKGKITTASSKKRDGLGNSAPLFSRGDYNNMPLASDPTSFFSAEMKHARPSFVDSSKVVDGWMLGSNSQILFWVPPGLRTGIWRPNNTAVIGNLVTTKLNVESFVHGEDWSLCQG